MSLVVESVAKRFDRFAALKADYDKNGPGRSNLRYGYVARQS